MVGLGQGGRLPVNAHQTLHPERVPEPWPASLRLSWTRANRPEPGRVWHPSWIQAALARVSGGRFPCHPETTTGYRLRQPGRVGLVTIKGIGKTRGRLRLHA